MTQTLKCFFILTCAEKMGVGRRWRGTRDKTQEHGDASRYLEDENLFNIWRA